ncbi:unnamed protein product [Schistosoma curassoni]|uniref:Aa_trans domain-containing protein n=1 Tax=Schistosoma curassoni TaxID=6186 RepID=A0A183JG79_9TREM|nr:unnamed protein product [Schistosoma curassoni]
MKTSTARRKHGIHWIARMQLEDLDFADDLDPLSLTQQQIREKMTSVAAASTARMWSIFAVTATSGFSASAGMLSGPSALPVLVYMMAMMISSIVSGPTLIGRSVGAASILGGFSGAGRFKSSLKCSIHLFHCSSVLVITLPSLLFTGRSGLQ